MKVGSGAPKPADSLVVAVSVQQKSRVLSGSSDTRSTPENDYSRRGGLITPAVEC